MRAALLIAGKDLRQRLRDASAILMAVVLPLALAAVLSVTLGRAVEVSRIPVAVADLDHGSMAQAFRQQVLGPVQRHGLIRLATAPTMAQARRLVDRGTVQAAIVIPPGFSHTVQAGGTADLQVIGDVDQPVAASVAQSLATSFAQDLNAVRLSVATALHAPGLPSSAQVPAGLAEQASRMSSPVSVEDVSAASKELDAKTYVAAGMAVFFLFFTVQFGVTSLLDERKDGTLARLLAAPVSRGSILGGKVLTSFLLGIISMTVLIVATGLFLGAHWGNPAGVAILVLAGVTAATAVMVLVATLAKTSEQVGTWQTIIALVLGMLGGSFFPLSQAGGLFAKASLITPHAWFLRGLGDLAGGAGPAAVLPAAAVLVFAAIVGGIGLMRLRKLAEL
ncbi:MAG TPA: ABC transporter [Actinobacteria bacterium]|nr:ABC transporter [Actinomycetota bacterium]